MNNELKHHGVLGMKWGKRKATSSASSSTSKKKSKKPKQKLSSKEKILKGAKAVHKGATAAAIALITLHNLRLADAMFLGGAGNKLVNKGASAAASAIKKMFDGGRNVGGGWRFYQ